MKVPPIPPAEFITEDEHLTQYEGPLWRLFRTEGPHALPWNELRHYGPVPNMRFDPHPEPKAIHPNVGVSYTASLPFTAIGEVFQQFRVIDRTSGRPTLTSWFPARPLKLLNLTTNWPVKNGAAAAMMMGSKRNTQAWARAIHEEHGQELDGLFHQSSINNQPLITLFTRSERVPAFPQRVGFSVLLSDTGADEIVDEARRILGYRVVS